jgi:hypothetical protein
MGGILSQVGSDGVEHPCAYASKVLKDPETRYAPCHLEAAGVLWACRHFRPYLVGQHFTIRTDHKPLLSLNKTHGFALDRIYAEMEEFLPFTFEYLQGDKMPADGLSRLSANVASVEWSLTVTDDQLYELQKEDKYVKAVICYLKFGRLPDSSNLRRLVTQVGDKAKIRHGLVGIERFGRFLVYAPLSIRSTLLELAHDDKLAGHLGSVKTLGRLQDCWFWPGMSTEVQNYCQSCHVCLQVNPAGNSRPAPLEPMPTVTRFNERVHVDLLGPLPDSPNGNKYLLVIVDAFSSWMECCAIPNKKANTVVKAFLDCWVTQHSFCNRMHTDLGTEFSNVLFKELSARLGFSHTFSSAAHPTSNGAVERANRSIIAYVRKFVVENSGWEDLLFPLRFALNTAPHSTKRFTPYQMVYGRRPTLAHMLFNPTKSYSPDEWEQRLALLNRMTQEIIEWQMEAFERQKAEFDKRAKEQSYSVGDIVYVTHAHTGTLFQKFQRKYDGPYILVEKRQHNNWLLQSQQNPAKRRRVHGNRLKAAPFRQQLYDENNPSPDASTKPLAVPNLLYQRAWKNLARTRVGLRSQSQKLFLADDEDGSDSRPPAIPQPDNVQLDLSPHTSDSEDDDDDEGAMGREYAPADTSLGEDQEVGEDSPPEEEPPQQPWPGRRQGAGAGRAVLPPPARAATLPPMQVAGPAGYQGKWRAGFPGRPPKGAKRRRAHPYPAAEGRAATEEVDVDPTPAPPPSPTRVTTRSGGRGRALPPAGQAKYPPTGYERAKAKKK